LGAEGVVEMLREGKRRKNGGLGRKKGKSV